MAKFREGDELMTENPVPEVSIGQKLQSLPRQALYILLMIVCVIPLFLNIHAPDLPSDYSIDLYANLLKIPDGSTVLLSSDWTNSTRGENKGQFDAIVKILMRKKVKLVIFTISDPQAPQVARNEMQVINDEMKAANQPTYKPWDDYVIGGFFPSGDGTANAMSVSLNKAFDGKKDIDDNGKLTDIFESPVLKGISTISQTSALIGIESTNATTTYIQKLGQKIEILFGVTGVMGPESLPYYQSGQVSGLLIGLKGGYDLENLMEYGVNHKDSSGKVAIATTHISADLPPSTGGPNFGEGSQYYSALTAALSLMILAVIVGNIGMYLVKKEKK